MNKEEYENWFKYRININPCSFEGGIINECRKMDKADVYQWLVNDELKIIELKEKVNKLETNRDEAIELIENPLFVDTEKIDIDYLIDIVNKNLDKVVEILKRGKE